MIGDRVTFHDYVGIPQKGTVVYEEAHRTEPDVFWLGIVLDNPDLNIVDIETVDGTTMMVGAYIRSDEVNPLIE